MNPPAVRYLARRCDCSRSFEERIRRGGKMPPEKHHITVLLLLLLWVFASKLTCCCLHFIKHLHPLIRIAITTHLLPLHCLLCLLLYNSCVLLLWPATRLHLTHLESQTVEQKISANAPALTKKRNKLLSDLIKFKAPCNLLIFGAQPQCMKLSIVSNQAASQSF